jgi:hypothetical protein
MKGENGMSEGTEDLKEREDTLAAIRKMEEEAGESWTRNSTRPRSWRTHIDRRSRKR